KRSMERMQEIEQRLREGMTTNGISLEAQEQIVKSITSFALYGFPESHAASFALIAYASAYIKAHHPAAFYMALLNGWPMGFYHPATVIKDAQRHGVKVLPVDVNTSAWNCRWEKGAVRLGMKFVRGLHGESVLRVEAAQPYTSADDLARRAQLRDDQLTKLAYAGAMASFGLTRRAALWQASYAAKQAGELFDGDAAVSASPLPEMSSAENTMADYGSMELTTDRHLLEHFRPQLRRDGVLTADQLKHVPNGSRVATAGAVIVRQRPGTAKGFVFLTLEDETGLSQAIVPPQLFADARTTILNHSGLIVEGIVQNQEGQPSVRAEKFWPLDGVSHVNSYDFH
ncbi:MAG TPA: OB-fold nucleic acid binding domain-containing protein, partial [Thermoanaerobaculia bacterium]|nr:OB-fold nucleic acid binding domain-containing protein [Thermoanaerobaculia bacterium]